MVVTVFTCGRTRNATELSPYLRHCSLLNLRHTSAMFFPMTIKGKEGREGGREGGRGNPEGIYIQFLQDPPSTCTFNKLMSALAKGSTSSIKSTLTAHLESWATGALLSWKIFVLVNDLDSSLSIPTFVSLFAIT